MPGKQGYPSQIIGVNKKAAEAALSTRDGS